MFDPYPGIKTIFDHAVMTNFVIVLKYIMMLKQSVHAPI